MSLFGGFSVAGSGLDAYQTWLDAISSNVANADDAVNPSSPAYQPAEPVVQPVVDGSSPSDGVAVTGTAYGSSAGILEHDPGNPNANAQGYVRVPAVDLGQQMVDMVQAERGYQANASSLDQVRQAYESALQIGA